MTTFLQSFIKQEISRYVEPTRQGTARGEPVGLSSVKFKSTLFFLTSLPGKKIAEAANVSYGILRVWRTESSYRNMIEKHIEAFARNVVRHLSDVVESTKEHGSRSEGDYVYLVVGTKINDQLAEDFADIPIYSGDLMEEIYRQAKATMFENSMFESAFLSHLGLVFALRKGYTLPLTGQVVPDSPIVKERQLGSTFFAFVEALQKPWIPDKERVEEVKIQFLKEM